MWCWTRTFYAKRNGVYFNFESKHDRDDAVNRFGFEAVSSKEAYEHYSKDLEFGFIRIGWRYYKSVTEGTA